MAAVVAPIVTPADGRSCWPEKVRVSAKRMPAVSVIFFVPFITLVSRGRDVAGGPYEAVKGGRLNRLQVCRGVDLKIEQFPL